MGTGLSETFITGLTETATTDKEGLGKLRFEDGKWYKWVLYDDGTANLDIVAGDALCYKADAYDAHTVVADETDADALAIPAGVAVATVTADQTYMWIQIKGYAVATQTFGGTTPAAGDTLMAGEADKTFTVDPGDNRVRAGFIMNVSGKEMVLDCPF